MTQLDLCQLIGSTSNREWVFAVQEQLND